LVTILVVISPIDRPDVTPHTIALVTVLNNIILAKLFCRNSEWRKPDALEGVTPEDKQLDNFLLVAGASLNRIALNS
jgi:hypothetical protein